MKSLITGLGLLRQALSIPFMFLFGFKIPVTSTKFVLGDFFMATQPWLFTWLIALNLIAMVLDLKELYGMYRKYIKKQKSKPNFATDLFKLKLPHEFYQKLFFFSTFTLGLTIGSAFFIAFLITTTPVLAVVAKTFLTIAFGCMLLQTVYEAGRGKKAAWIKQPAVHSVNFLNASFSVATLVILLFFPGVSAVAVSILAITCTVLTIIQTYQGQQGKKAAAKPQHKSTLTNTRNSGSQHIVASMLRAGTPAVVGTGTAAAVGTGTAAAVGAGTPAAVTVWRKAGKKANQPGMGNTDERQELLPSNTTYT